MRETRIDVIKGITIVLVVVAHTGIANKFISLFHMAVFFIASGYCFDFCKVLDLKNYSKFFLRKVRTLYVPFVISSLFFMLIQNTLIQAGFYSSDVCLYNIRTGMLEIVNILKFGTEKLGSLGGTLWFLRVLFLLNVIYGFCAYLINKTTKYYYIPQFTIGIVLLIFGYYLGYTNTRMPLDFNVVCSIYILFAFGEWYKYFLQKTNRLKWQVNLFLIFSCTALLILEYNLYPISIGIGANQYSSPEHLIVSSISGWILMWIIASYIILIPYLQKLIIKLSKESLWIMILHFSAFKMATKIFQFVGLLDESELQDFPVPVVNIEMKVVYIICGILIPIFISELIKRLKAFARGKYKNDINYCSLL